MKDLKRKIDGALEGGKGLDPYSAAHLTEAQQVIAKALDSNFIYNIPRSFVGFGGGMIILGAEKDAKPLVLPVEEPAPLPETVPESK